MKRKEIEQKVTELVNNLLSGDMIELVDVEYVKEGQDYFLRIFIDKPDGVTINDCETLSRKMDGTLDEHDWIKEHYYLEVSSPGLDRPLKKLSDFQRNIGKRVEIKLYQPLDNKKLYEGILVSKDAENIVIESDQGQPITFTDSQVALVRLAIIF